MEESREKSASLKSDLEIDLTKKTRLFSGLMTKLLARPDENLLVCANCFGKVGHLLTLIFCLSRILTVMSSRRLLLVHAHPDDETISTGITMAKYAKAGVEVTLVTCTSGEEGEVLVPSLSHLASNNNRIQIFKRKIFISNIF